MVVEGNLATEGVLGGIGLCGCWLTILSLNGDGYLQKWWPLNYNDDN